MISRISLFTNLLTLTLIATTSQAASRLAAGGDQSLALSIDGLVLFWGANDSSTPYIMRDLEQIQSIAAGNAHQLALKKDGTVWSWGLNRVGQLGTSSRIPSSVATQVFGIDNVIAIAAGGNSSYALKNDGTVWAWGNNDNGQLGDRSNTSRTYPVLMEGLQGIREIAAGEEFFFARRDDGAVCSWSLFNLTLSCSQSDAKMIAAGGSSAYTLNNSGEVRQISGSFCESRSDGVILNQVTDISAGVSHLLMKRFDGSLWSCGVPGITNYRTSSSFRPETVSTLGLVSEIAAGRSHSLARSTDGSVWAWGDNLKGQLGTGGPSTPIPSRVFDGTGQLHR